MLSAKWDNVGQVAAGEKLTYKVEGLTPKKTYKFRIRAVNKLGPSEPGVFAKPILAKDPWGMYLALRFTHFNFALLHRFEEKKSIPSTAYALFGHDTNQIIIAISISQMSLANQTTLNLPIGIKITQILNGYHQIQMVVHQLRVTLLNTKINLEKIGLKVLKYQGTFYKARVPVLKKTANTNSELELLIKVDQANLAIQQNQLSPNADLSNHSLLVTI